MNGIPDLIGPLYGWRYWGEWHDELLCSPWYRAGPWTPGHPHEALCMSHHDHAAPQLHCRCGIYAHRTPRQVPPMRVPYLGSVILGQVALWGRVVEHSFGWRAELAYPVLLIVYDGSRTIKRIAESYGVPVMTPDEYHEREEARDALYHV